MRRLLVVFILVNSVVYIGNLTINKENKNIAISSVYAEQILFTDNFEKKDLREWRSGVGIAPYWEIKKIEGNYVLSGKGLASKDALIDVGGDDWTDYSFRIKVKRIAGTLSLAFRLSQNGRYYIIFDENKGLLSLVKNKPWGKNFDLSESNIQLNKNKWYILNIIVQGNNIKVLVDEDLKIDYTDSDPLLYGCISIISLKGAEVQFDDVKIESLTP